MEHVVVLIVLRCSCVLLSETNLPGELANGGAT